GVPTQPLSEALTDAGRFAYCGLVTAALYHLFTDAPTTPHDAKTTADVDFAINTLTRLTRYLGLPSQVREVMELTVRGEVEPSASSGYVSILKEEAALSRSCLPIVQDLVMFAVQGGCYDARIRVLIMHVTCLLHVNVDLLEMYEESVLEYLTMEQNPITEWCCSPIINCRSGSGRINVWSSRCWPYSIVCATSPSTYENLGKLWTTSFNLHSPWLSRRH
ncbi:hypothetical protein OTU49_006707, partial [Cherax quadricarinatus]